MIAPTADGGCYISWFDSIANGFDVRLQKLDAGGNELWAHGGILVCDRSFSSTQSYGLDVVGGHGGDNALLTFRDDSGTGVQITAARVTPGGILVWGTAGVTLTNTTDFVASPKITGDVGAGAIIAWTQGSSVMLQKLDLAGAPQWPGGITLTPSAGTYSVSDLHNSGYDVILSIVHQTGPQFWHPKHLLAQKFDAAGNELWGATPLSVFDSGSLQIGNFPPFTPDGSGGALFAWYGTGPLQCYAQHVLAAGTEAFPHNGVAGSTNSAQVRVNPSVDYDAGSGATYLFWTEQNTGQSMCGLSGQKFDAAGNRQWTDQGATLIPVGSPEIRQVKTTVSGGGAFVFWTHIPSFGTDTLHGAHVDATGAYDVTPFEVGSTPSGKSRLDVARGTTGQVVLAWSDQRVDSGDILAQNVNPDGTLGSGGTGSAYCFGISCPCANDDPTAGCANSGGSGGVLSASGDAVVGADTVVLHAAGLIPGQFMVFFQGDNQVNNGNGVSFGDGLRCAGGNVWRYYPPLTIDGAGTVDSTGHSISGEPGANSTVNPGDTKHYQGWYRDPGGSCGLTFNLTNALSITWQ